MSEITDVTFKAEVICVFHSFHQWVSQASRMLGAINKFKHEVICLDKNGNCCMIGEDFATAEAQDAFPVTAYRLIRTIETKK